MCYIYNICKHYVTCKWLLSVFNSTCTSIITGNRVGTREHSGTQKHPKKPVHSILSPKTQDISAFLDVFDHPCMDQNDSEIFFGSLRTLKRDVASLVHQSAKLQCLSSLFLGDDLFCRCRVGWKVERRVLLPYHLDYHEKS